MKNINIQKKILIVDDRPENLISLSMLLSEFDAEIIKASSGNEALAFSLQHEFALVLMDVQMPEMDGFETVRIMRKVERTKLLPVIFLSAIYHEDQYQIEGIEAGAVDFITKPINPRILLGKVKIFLDLYDQKKKLEYEIERRKQVEKMLLHTKNELLEAKNKAEESDKLKTAFLANMSHEIRTPLNAIVGFSDILATRITITEEKKKEFQNYIHKSSIALTNIINDILDIAKIEAGQLKIELQPVNISTLMEELEATFREELKKKQKTFINLKLSIPGDPEIVTETDPFRLKQIISNLLNNALKFTLEGEISFGYEISDDGLQFFVKDSGVGIPAHMLGHVFERFWQADNTKSLNTSGTGLGLSIVKKLTEILGGKIWVDSMERQGTCFSFTLPRNEFQWPEEKTTTPDTALRMINGYDWSGSSILVAEDQDYNFTYLKEIITPTMAEVFWARNGQEAIEMFQQHRSSINIILMDIKMPNVSGLEAFREIRKFSSQIPVVAVTAYAMDEERENYLRTGFSEYITKPVDSTKLLQVIDSFMMSTGINE